MDVDSLREMGHTPMMLFMVMDSLREKGHTGLCALWIWIPYLKWVTRSFIFMKTTTGNVY